MVAWVYASTATAWLQGVTLAKETSAFTKEERQRSLREDVDPRTARRIIMTQVMVFLTTALQNKICTYICLYNKLGLRTLKK